MRFPMSSSSSTRGTVLVTGGAGFIGSHLCERLAGRDRNVVILDDLNDYYDPEIKRANVARLGRRIVFKKGDIRDTKLVTSLLKRHRVESVVHLAARAGVRPSVADPVLYAQVNVEGTSVILEAARKAGVARILFASSSSVYGKSARLPFREDDTATDPVSPYAATKRAGELLCAAHHSLYGTAILALRLFTVYGPRQRPDMAIQRFARAILAGREIPMFGDGSSRRDYTHVSDIVDGIVAGLSWREGFEIVNLGGSRTITLKNLIDLLARSAGRPARLKRLPNQEGDVPATYADVSKAGRLLGYRPRVSLPVGIAGFVADLRKASGTPRETTA